jgi:hypothetical protein
MAAFFILGMYIPVDTCVFFVKCAREFLSHFVRTIASRTIGAQVVYVVFYKKILVVLRVVSTRIVPLFYRTLAYIDIFQ